MTSTPEEFFTFIIGGICLSLSLYCSLKLISKYFKYKRKEFIHAGITGIIITEPWWPNFINYLLILLGQAILPFEIYNIIALIGLPMGLFSWLYVVSELMYKERQKELLMFAIIYGVFFEIIVIPIVLVDPLFTSTVFGISNFVIVSIFSFIIELIPLITGLLFARLNLMSDNPEIRLKGRFLVYAFIAFFISGIIYSFIALPPIFFTLVYVGLLSSAISFYYGFISSKRMIKLFIRAKNREISNKLD